MFKSSKSTRISRSALLPYSPEQIYRLVADVEAYPQFLPWCRSVEVLESAENEVCARMEIARGPVSKSLTTRNIMRPFESISLTLVDGPFSQFQGSWTFEPRGSTAEGRGCEVTLELEFEIAGLLLRKTLGPVFGEIANTMVGAFSKRAENVYGAA
ncbi:MAG: type II toxin-antitoxin system RatA family toxin [Gammaproteobacteria bacterium]|nr:type II toxin-antitoxin system RatA family toxin [Gammaproteobacteria bacterium]